MKTANAMQLKARVKNRAREAGIPPLWTLRRQDCSMETLREALDATCEKRGSAGRIAAWKQVLDEVEKDDRMLALWAKYSRKNPYVSGIRLEECCATARGLMSDVAGL